MNDEGRQKGATERARWLAEVAEALETARLLLAKQATLVTPTSESLALAEHITAAIAAVEALRRGGQRRISEQPCPEWIKQPPDRLGWPA